MARKLKLDFTGVESFSRCSEGIHRAKVAEIQEKTSQGGDDMLQVAMEVVAGADKGCRVFDNCVLTDKALWKFKQLLSALGVKCDGKVAVDLDGLIGKTCDIEVFHEEYNGQTRAKISNYSKVATAADAEDDDDDEEEDEEEVKPSKKSKAAPAKTPAKKKPVKKEEPEDEDEEEDEDDEEEEEEAPKPTKKKPAPEKKAAPAKKTAKKKPEPEPEEDDDEDDDDDWEEA